MKITAYVGITAPFKGESFAFKPEDIGDVDDEIAKKLIAEGHAGKARKGDDNTYRKAPDRGPIAKPGVKKLALKPEKAAAIKPKAPETKGDKRRRTGAALLGDKGRDPDKGVGEDGKRYGEGDSNEE